MVSCVRCGTFLMVPLLGLDCGLVVYPGHTQLFIRHSDNGRKRKVVSNPFIGILTIRKTRRWYMYASTMCMSSV